MFRGLTKLGCFSPVMGMDPEQEALLWPHVALGAFTKGQSLTQVWVAQKWECYGAFLPLHEVSEVSAVP